MANFVSAHPDARRYGAAHDGHLQWTFITGVNSSDAGDICFRNEAFCGAFAETAIDAPGTVAYLEQAVRFANQTLWGNLTATIVAHPASLRDKRVGAAIDRAVADLRYGTVLINQFAAFGIFLMTATWGAYPGNEMHDIQSGIGVTTNVLMFDSPQKSVVRGPFIMRPDPFNITSRAVVGYGKKMVEFQREPSLSKVPGYLWSALGK